MKINNFT